MRSSTPTAGMRRALAAALAATVLGFTAGAANSQPTKQTRYAVKFVCGKAGVSTAAASVPVAPGFYFTAINVHNPGSGVDFSKKFAQALVNQKAGKVVTAGASLNADEAFDVECVEITKRLGLAPNTFVTGFVTFRIAPGRELDVVAVYTAAASPHGPVVTLNTERVPKQP